MTKNILLFAGLCGAPVAAFTAVHQASLSRPQRSALFYSPTNPMDSSTTTSSSGAGLNTKTALPVSNMADAIGENVARFPVSRNATGTSDEGFDTYEQQHTIQPPSDGLPSLVDQFMNSYVGPRLLLAAVACLYGTNFPLGTIMDQALPASAATSSRMVIAATALSPFLFQLPRELIGMSLLAGLFTSGGYVAQSMALVDTSPATVSFLGAIVVIWCPFLEWLLHKTPMGWKDRPQTWMAATMCMSGVGVLELCGPDSAGALSTIGMGDGLAILQAIGFGTGIFLSEQMMKDHPTQALPITSVMVATTAFVAMIWSLTDGWIGSAPGWESMTLPGLFADPSMHEVAMAVVFTGLVSTSLNFFLENFSLGKVSSGEASVILATEPLWAAAFASVMLGESFGWNDYTGGALIVGACLVNSVKPSDLQQFLFRDNKEEETTTEAGSTQVKTPFR